MSTIDDHNTHTKDGFGLVYRLRKLDAYFNAVDGKEHRCYCHSSSFRSAVGWPSSHAYPGAWYILCSLIPSMFKLVASGDIVVTTTVFLSLET